MNKTPPKKKPRIVRRTENTAKILNASIKCLNEHGYGGTTLLSIAAAAGVSRGQVQNIFGVKRTDLLLRIAEEIFARYVDKYLAAIEGAADAKELTGSMWDAIAKLYDKPETLALIEIWLSTRNDKPFNKTLRQMLTQIDARLNARWASVFEQDGVDVEIVQVIRYLQRGIMRGLAIERLMGGKDVLFDKVIDEARKTSLRMIDDSLAAPR